MWKLSWLSLLFLSAAAQAAADYFSDTFAGLECLRQGAQLMPDMATVTRAAGPCPIEVSALPTSPSNIALDLLVQLEALGRGELRATANANILNTVQVLANLPRDLPSGLFYNRYTSGNSQAAPGVADSYLSSIDNLHLAYALWVLSEVGPKETRVLSGRLFASMKFDLFYDLRDGLFAGGARFVGGQPVLERWKYRYFGSEARSLYSIGWALGLIDDPEMIVKSMHSLEVDIFEWDEANNGQTQELMGLWDGGAFQLLLPRLLISEEQYAPRLRSMFEGYGRYVIREGERQGFPVPASHSACQFDLFEYLGKAGSVGLVTPRNLDVTDPGLRVNWDRIFTPHAAFLAASLSSGGFVLALENAEALVDSDGTALYRPGLGWMDALHLHGPQKGRITPVQLSFDQGIIALAASQLGLDSPMTAGARALRTNPRTRQRLKSFYRAVSPLLDRAPRYPLPNL